MFSVIIPTFNRPMMLHAAIASVLAQEDTMFDIILVDDGNGSGVRVAEALQNPAITVLDNRKRGQVRARNLAVAHARQPFIAFLDDDDEWTDPQHLARAKSALANNADLWFSGGDLVEDGRAPVPFMVAADARSLERDNGILVSGVCYHRGLHERLGTFDETLQFYWDWDWYLRIARAEGRLKRDPNRSVSIRRHRSNVTRPGLKAERAAELKRLAAKHRLGQLELKTHADLVA
jgi:glycosyltransferase involved in cell wall biosynthesis